MSYKILVADDSLTIQKVIGITLASTDMKPFESLNEDDLHTKLKMDHYDLLLLDINLSEKKNGAALIRELVSLYPELPILVMLGTFDTVDENELYAAGAKDKVIKPFDGQKFIERCRELIESSPNKNEQNQPQEQLQQSSQDEDIEVESEIEEENESENDQGWGIMDSPKVLSLNKSREKHSPHDKNALKNEIEGWGMSVPGVIGKHQHEETLAPPRIGDNSSLYSSDNLDDDQSLGDFSVENMSSNISSSSSTEEDEKIVLPDDDDLDFPDLELFSRQASSDDLKDVKLTSKLVPLSDLTDDSEEEDDDATDPNFQRPQETSLELEMEVNSEISPDDFWAADESSDNQSFSFDSIDTKVETEELFKPDSSYQLPAAASINEQEIVERLKTALTPLIENMVKDLCKNKIEQVAWEVIPDLAENLIKKELQDLSQSLK